MLILLWCLGEQTFLHLKCTYQFYKMDLRSENSGNKNQGKGRFLSSSNVQLADYMDVNLPLNV